MKDCFSLHFLKYFERLYAGEMDFFSWRTRTPEQAH
jgi:hypothetical protein